MIKKLILPIVSIVIFAGALAQANGLEDAMKGMAASLKAIGKQINDTTKNADSKVVADQFVQFATEAKKFIPSTITSLPAADQPPLIADYQKRLDDVVILGNQLSDAFKLNDNVQAKQILGELGTVKKDGHDKYKPKKP
jgi:hypothetical protein